MKRAVFHTILLAFLILGCENSNTELYIDFIRQFDESIGIIQQNNSFIYQQFIQVNFENPARTKRWLDNVNKNKQKRIHLCKFIDSIQNRLDTAAYTKIIQFPNPDNDLANKKVRLNKADVEFIKKEMKVYNNYFKAFIDDRKKYELLLKMLNSSLDTDSLSYIRVFNSSRVNLLETIACLMKVKTEIILAENNWLHYSISQIDVGDFKFRKIEAIVVPNSQILPIGQPYQAEIYLTSIDTTLNYYFEIDKKQFETKAGIGNYRFKVKDKPGVYSKNGNFFFKSPVNGEIQNYPFKLEYVVLEKK